MIDPSRLLASAERLYGDEMEKLWGEVAPVPAERVTVLEGGEEVEGLEVHYAPGHARHHVVYFDPASATPTAATSPACRVPPSELVAAPTPPPEIEVEVWRESLAMLRSLEPARLCITHFGGERRMSRPSSAGSSPGWRRPPRRASPGTGRGSPRWLAGRFDAEGGEIAERLRQAMPPDQLWLGLERYWRKRREAEQAA